MIISTGTRTLQDQLFHRDLPLLGAALGRGVTVALLKGRANYLCRERWKRLPSELPLEGAPGAVLAARVAAWAQAWHLVTPLKLQIKQMKVPHPSQG